MSLSVKNSIVVGTYPDSLTVRADSAYTKADTDNKNIFWQKFAQILSIPHPQQIWQLRDMSMSPKELLGFIDATTQFLGGGKVGRDKAAALGNYACGGGMYKGFFQDYLAFSDVDDYLDPENIVSEGTMQPWNIAMLLNELRTSNPAAHTYLVCKILAKAKRVAQSNDGGYSLSNNPQVNTAIDSAKEVGKVAVDTTTNVLKIGAKTIANVGGIGLFIAENVGTILLVTVGVVGYIAYRNRAAISEIATTAIRSRLPI